MRFRMLILTFLTLLMMVSAVVESHHARSIQPSSEHASAEQTDPVADTPLKMAYSETLGQDNTSYHFQSNANGYTASNPAHQLDIDVSGEAVTVTVNDDTWQLSSHDAAREFSVEGNRLTVHHDGYDEWYVNGPLGLQQGFTLYEPSEVTFDVGGTLPTSATGAALTMGDSLTFSGLMAYDAAGQDVPVAFDLKDTKLAYVYDDAAVTYPITIDPWVQQAKLLASDGEANDAFGVSVALDGDTALVGASWEGIYDLHPGIVYVFVRSGMTWSQQASLRPFDASHGDCIGCSVSLDGDTALVGAPYHGDNGQWSGSAYVFTGSGSTWSQQAKLLPADGAGGVFGWSVALNGDVALIGAALADGNALGSGSAYVFTRSGTTWTQQAKLTASDGTEGDYFGVSVALDGATALIGAALADGSALGSGSAYVFTRSGTTWTQQAKLVSADGAGGDYFGTSVALDGDTVLIGTEAQAAYVFTRSGTTWSQQAKLLPADGFAYHFGYEVALSGDTALVGAKWDDDNGRYSGSAYVFVRSGTTWIQQKKILPADGAADDWFGSAVALSGDTALVGASGDDDNGVDSGSAYVFTYDATILSAAAVCNGANLDVIIASGEGPFNISGTGPSLPLNGVSAGTHTLNGPGMWTGVTVTETTGNIESSNLGDFTCPVPPTNTPSITYTPSMTYTPSITNTPSDTPTPTFTPSNTPTVTPTGPIALVVSATCVNENLEVTISAGNGPFDITASAGMNTPVLGVWLGTTVITGPEKWDNLSVAETVDDTESINLGQFKCRTDERPWPLAPENRARTTNPFPVFGWTELSFANDYRLFVFDNKVVADRTVDIRENSGGPTSMTLSVPLPLRRLFWRVRARTNRVWGLWSVRFTLFIDLLPLTAPTPVPTIDLSDGDSTPDMPPTPVVLPTFPPPPNSR